MRRRVQVEHVTLGLSHTGNLRGESAGVNREDDRERGLAAVPPQLASLACGSKSMMAVFRPARVDDTARCKATVVFPAPPF